MISGQPFRIIVVDDDKGMRLSLVELLEAAGWEVSALARAEKTQDLAAGFLPDVILSDVRMPGMTGTELLASLDKSTSPPVVLISAHGDIPMAVNAMQNGAYSFVEKPYEPRRLLTILRHAAEQNRMQKTNERLQARLIQLSGLDRLLLGQTEAVRNLRADIIDFATLDTPIMVQGETGTGKELVARALHDLGPDPAAPFLALNCAALSPDTFEVEMFGKHGESDGRLLTASGGTLFLDEICSAPLAVQAKLLRIIEDKQVLPIGGTDPVPVNLRFLSATNEDVDQAVSDGRLRQDLLFRLNTVVLNIPALRNRRDDVMLLAAHFLDEFASVYEIDRQVLSNEDTAALLAHDWPGNVRELRNVCERRILLARRGSGSIAEALRTDHLDDVPETLREAVAAFERELIGKAIKAHKGRMDAAAEALGIGRRTLNEKIVKLGLNKGELL